MAGTSEGYKICFLKLVIMSYGVFADKIVGVK